MNAWRVGVAVLLTGTVGLTSACGSKEESEADTSGPAAATTASTGELATSTPAADGAIEHLRWAQPEEPTSLDPAKALTQTENPIVSNLCESLFRVTPDQQIEPNLATSFENPDPKTWVYTLRDDVTFTDGTPMTAEDVAFSLGRHVDPKVGSYWALYYRNVDSVKATGPDEVTVRLKHPDYVFNQVLATAGGAVSQKAAVQKAGDKYGSPSAGVSCTGPFSLAKWTTGTSIELERNPSYWNGDLASKASSVTWQFLGDEATATSALTTGEVQGMYEAPISGVTQLREAGSFYTGVSGLQIDMIVTADSGPLADPRVRKAIFLATDREAIASTVFDGTAQPAQSLMNDRSWTYGDDVFEAYFSSLDLAGSNVEEAKRLVEEAGATGQSITIAAENFASYTQLADIVAQSASAIGLKADIKVLPPGGAGALFFDAKAREGLDGFVTTWYTPTADPLENLSYFLPDSAYNYGGFDDPELNEIVAEGYAAEDEDARAEIAVEGYRIMDEQVPWIPLVEVANRLYMDPSVSGAPASFFAYLNSPWANLVGATE